VVGGDAKRRGWRRPRKLSKAVFWMLRMGRSYREVEPHLAPQGQGGSGGPYMADS